MKEYKPVSDREIARRLSITSIRSAYYYFPIIKEIFNLGLVICERVDRPQGEWVHSHEGTIAEGLYCSNCGKYGYGEKDCPNCGARMKGADYE